MLRSIIEWLTAKQEIEYLKRRVDALEKELSKLEDENKSLWFMLDEIKEEEKAVATALQEELTDELLRNMEPIGRA
jgi:cell division protein FtsB